MKNTAPHIVRYAHPSQAALDAIVTLRHCRAGLRNQAAALQALRTIEYIYGPPLKVSVALFRRGLHINDPYLQKEVLYESLHAIIDWIFHEPLKAAAWETALRFRRALKKSLLALVASLSLAGGFKNNKPVAVRLPRL
jgi:hypothetical protein